MDSDTADDVTPRALATLASARRSLFLTYFGQAVTIEGRGGYGEYSARRAEASEASTDLEGVNVGIVIACNEIALMIFTELWRDLLPPEPRPTDEEWLGDAKLKAAWNGALPTFMASLTKALELTDRASDDA